MDFSNIDLTIAEAEGWVPGRSVLQYELGPGRNFVYLILDQKTRRAAIVDPQKDLAGVLSDLEREGFALERILLTHTHYDHIAGVEPLLDLFPGLEVWVGQADAHRLPARVRVHAGFRPYEGKREIPVGDLRVQPMHTPGHTEGGHCLFLPELSPPVLLTGDLVFIGDCGRTDLPGGSDAEMFSSLQTLKSLPSGTILGVGHHYSRPCWTTLGRELEESPPFQCASVEELARL